MIVEWIFTLEHSFSFLRYITSYQTATHQSMHTSLQMMSMAAAALIAQEMFLEDPSRPYEIISEH